MPEIDFSRAKGLQLTIQIEQHEREPLQVVMRDLQLSVARYYAGTASREDLGALVRSFINNSQTLNDWLTNAITQASSYVSYFQDPRRPGARYIEAVKYVRNVVQHVMHVVSPGGDVTLVGGSLGYRLYAAWDEVPQAVHDQLRPGTRKLKGAYDSVLLGQEVTGTMLEVLRFYADVAPEIVHRDDLGEWTGFPLMSQPGMSHALHPEEPVAGLSDALAWLDARRPGGSARLILGQVTEGGDHYVFGCTFIGELSFAPFFETVAQVNADITAGYDYRQGPVGENLRDVSALYPDAPQSGQVLASRGELSSWTESVPCVTVSLDWCDPHFEREGFISARQLEDPSYVPDSVAYEVRRARRLNALVPVRVSF